MLGVDLSIQGGNALRYSFHLHTLHCRENFPVYSYHSCCWHQWRHLIRLLQTDSCLTYSGLLHLDRFSMLYVTPTVWTKLDLPFEHISAARSTLDCPL